MDGADRQRLRYLVDGRVRRATHPPTCPRGYLGESGYTLGCRCPLCAAASREARKRRRAHPHVHTHNYSGYSNGCRCPACTTAHAAWTRERRRHTLPA